MKILAFETSCDDTSVALLEDDRVVALSTRTQLEHDATGGVVPEVAARSHANAIFPCLEDVLRESDWTLEDIDIIACTESPGLAPSLLTGKTVARTLALSLGIPLVWVDHIEAHIFANFLERSQEEVGFPSVVLTISGGHTELYLWKSLFELEMLGQTRDDAVGEAYDKVAKMMGMGFPGGAKLARLAEEFRESQALYDTPYLRLFPRAYIERDSLDFSLSGLKSAVKRYIDQKNPLTDEEKQGIAYAFEEAVFDVLVDKFFLAAEKYHAPSLVLAGGVSANTALKDRIAQRAQQEKKHFIAPKKILYSQDNAAMVGIRAYYERQSQK